MINELLRSQGALPNFVPHEPTERLEVFNAVLQRTCLLTTDLLLNLSSPELAGKIIEMDLIESALGDLRELLKDKLFNLVPSLGSEERKGALIIKRAISNEFSEIKENQDTENLRVFLGEFIEKWNYLCQKHLILSNEIASNYESESERCQKQLTQFAALPRIQDGVFFSGSKFYRALARYLTRVGRNPKRTKEDRQFEFSLYRHLRRGATKSIPRGLLAGVSIASSGILPNDADIIGPHRLYLNIALARMIADWISNKENLALAVFPRLNPGWNIADGKVSFCSTPIDNPDKILSLPLSPMMRQVIADLEPRQYRSFEIIERIYKKFFGDYTKEEIEEYFFKLCDLGLVIGNLEIPREKFDGVEYIQDWLSRIPENDLFKDKTKKWKDEISCIKALLESMSQLSQSENVRLRQLVDLEVILARFGAKEPDRSIYLDVQANFPLSISKEEVRSASKTAIELHRIFVNRSFCAKETKANGSSDEVETPIWNIVKKLSYDPGTSKKGKEKNNYDWKVSGRNSLYCNVIQEWLENGNYENEQILDIEKTGLLERIKALPQTKLPPPDHGVVCCRMMVCEKHSDPSNRYFVVSSIHSISTMMRFLGLLNNKELNTETEDIARSIMRKEEGTQCADIVNNWLSTVDQAGAVPNQFEYFVETYGARSDKDAKFLIPLNQIWLKRKIGKVEIIRRHQGKDIPLRLFRRSAVDMLGSPAINMIFCELAHRSDGEQFFRKFESHFPIRKHLPRIVYRNLVLVRETWRFEPSEIKPNLCESQRDSFIAWNRFRIKMKLPRFVFIDETYFDFFSPISMADLNQKMKDMNSTVVVREMLPTPENGGIRSSSGARYVTDFETGLSWNLK